MVVACRAEVKHSKCNRKRSKTPHGGVPRQQIRPRCAVGVLWGIRERPRGSPMGHEPSRGFGRARRRSPKAKPEGEAPPKSRPILLTPLKRPTPTNTENSAQRTPSGGGTARKPQTNAVKARPIARRARAAAAAEAKARRRNRTPPKAPAPGTFPNPRPGGGTWRTGPPAGAAGVTAGVQTPVTLVVGAEKATLTRRTLSGSTPVGDSHVGCGCHPHPAAKKNDVTLTHILISDRNIFSKKKYVSTSPRPGGHVGERNLFLSAIRRSNRRSQFSLADNIFLCRLAEPPSLF